MIETLLPFLDKNLSSKLKENLTEDFKKTDKFMLIISFVNFSFPLFTRGFDSSYKVSFILIPLLILVISIKTSNSKSLSVLINNWLSPCDNEMFFGIFLLSKNNLNSEKLFIFL